MEVFQRRVHVSDEHTRGDQQANPKLGDGRHSSYYSSIYFQLRVHSYLQMGHDPFSGNIIGLKCCLSPLSVEEPFVPTVNRLDTIIEANTLCR